MSETVNTRNFRENLKHFFDIAKEKPVAINRGSERYVLLSENDYVQMKEELMNLQKSLISFLQTSYDGGATEYTDVEEHHEGLLKEILADEPVLVEKQAGKKVAW